MPEHKTSISAFIVCMDEERNIRRCLESVAWCDEIVVVDSGSKDATLDICREYGAKIFEREWPGFIAQKQFALEQCSSEWILNIDADEEASDELIAEIKDLLGTAPAEAGFELNRVVFYLDRWWRRGGWYPEYRLRLCRRNLTKWGGQDPHEKAVVDGTTRRLKGELRHFTYVDIAHHLRTSNEFSTASAISMYKNGKRFSIINLILNPISRFFKFYFLKGGFREGVAGFFVALCEGHYVLSKYAKLWELEQRAKKRD